MDNNKCLSDKSFCIMKCSPTMCCVRVPQDTDFPSCQGKKHTPTIPFPLSHSSLQWPPQPYIHHVSYHSLWYFLHCCSSIHRIYKHICKHSTVMFLKSLLFHKHHIHNMFTPASIPDERPLHYHIIYSTILILYLLKFLNLDYGHWEQSLTQQCWGKTSLQCQSWFWPNDTWHLSNTRHLSGWANTGNVMYKNIYFCWRDRIMGLYIQQTFLNIEYESPNKRFYNDNLHYKTPFILELNLSSHKLVQPSSLHISKPVILRSTFPQFISLIIKRQVRSAPTTMFQKFSSKLVSVNTWNTKHIVSHLEHGEGRPNGLFWWTVSGPVILM